MKHGASLAVRHPERPVQGKVLVQALVKLPLRFCVFFLIIFPAWTRSNNYRDALSTFPHYGVIMVMDFGFVCAHHRVGCGRGCLLEMNSN